MNDCYVFLGIKNNGVYQLPTGYINDIRQIRVGTWHIALTDITLKAISDLPLHTFIGCDLCQDSAVNNRLIPVLRFLPFSRKKESVIFTNPYYIPITTSTPGDQIRMTLYNLAGDTITGNPIISCTLHLKYLSDWLWICGPNISTIWPQANLILYTNLYIMHHNLQAS